MICKFAKKFDKNNNSPITKNNQGNTSDIRSNVYSIPQFDILSTFT